LAVDICCFWEGERTAFYSFAKKHFNFVKNLAFL
jgi:hypothetical protein